MREAANREHGHISRRVRSRWSGNRVSRVSGVGQVCRAVGEREREREREGGGGQRRRRRRRRRLALVAKENLSRLARSSCGPEQRSESTTRCS